jgi:hypothetical protein
MISPVHHPLTQDRAKNVAAQTPQKAAQKQPAKPQAEQDSVKLTQNSNANRNGKSK